MKTIIPTERLAELKKQGRAQAGRSPFVDPRVIAQTGHILRNRGEEWAASVLMRQFTRRSLTDASWPWLEDGEPEALLLADQEEFWQIVKGL